MRSYVFALAIFVSILVGRAASAQTILAHSFGAATGTQTVITCTFGVVGCSEETTPFTYNFDYLDTLDLSAGPVFNLGRNELGNSFTGPVTTYQVLFLGYAPDGSLLLEGRDFDLEQGPGRVCPSGPTPDHPCIGVIRTATLASFTVASAPEPSTWAMMLLGFIAVGGALRRGRDRGRRPAGAQHSCNRPVR